MFASCGCGRAAAQLRESTLFDDEEQALRYCRRLIPNLDTVLSSHGASSSNHTHEAQHHQRVVQLAAALDDTQVHALALVCNNVHALRSVAQPPVSIAADRLLRRRIADPLPNNVACAAHHVPALRRRYAQREFVHYCNEWRVGDQEALLAPSDGQLRAVIEMFAQSDLYAAALSRCEVALGEDDAVPSLCVYARQFASLAQYRRALRHHATTQTDEARRVCVAQPRCVDCYPCVSTALLAMLPDSDDVAPSFSWALNDVQPVPMRLPRGVTSAAQLSATRYLADQQLATRQHALLWAFHGVHRALSTLFAVACGFREGERLCLDGLLVVEEVLTRTYIHYRMHAREAGAVQQRIAEQLRAGRLYDPLQAQVIESCALASAL